MNNLSHNVYSDEAEITLNHLCNYLILIEKDGNLNEIIPCTSLSKTIEIARNSRAYCKIYNRNGSIGKNWHYFCDVSVDLI